MAFHPDLRNVLLDDVGGRAALTQDGKELDINYLVLDFSMKENPLPDMYYGEPPEPEYDRVILLAVLAYSPVS